MVDNPVLANRLRKNLARLGPWARRERLDAWRLYDRDIPEFPWSIDRYGSEILIQEHVTPKSRRLDAAGREAEKEAVFKAVCDVLKTTPDHLHLKTRERHLSIERAAKGSPQNEFPVGEGDARLLVNLVDYLDTGLFLDHRPARLRVRKAAGNKRILNLFAYTGAFSVHAVGGGASRCVTVDLSQTYLAWAARNFALNRIDPALHPIVRADVFAYLDASSELFDVIVLDPPTVSRASGGKSFEVASAHASMIRKCSRVLAPDGWILFSTNDRSFALDGATEKAFAVREISAETKAQDFHEEAHRAFEIRRR